MHIDVHAHYFPPAYVESLARAGSTTTGGVGRAPGAGLSLEQRLDLMDAAGIGRQVLSVGPQQPYLADEAAAVAAARQANDLYADLVANQSGRFAAFGAVPLPHAEAALREAARCLDDLGFPGLTVGCSIAGRVLDDEALRPFWDDLDRRGALVFLHPVGAGVMGGGQPDYGLTWMVGAPFEDTVAALRLVLSGMLARYQRLRVIVPHLGGTLPFLLQRLDDAAERQRASDTRTGIGDTPPSTYARRLWFDTVNEHPPALRCACASFGVDRLLLGTDFPYLSGEKFTRCVGYVEETLAEDDAERVLGGNAAALLGWAEPGTGTEIKANTGAHPS